MTATISAGGARFVRCSSELSQGARRHHILPAAVAVDDALGLHALVSRARDADGALRLSLQPKHMVDID